MNRCMIRVHVYIKVQMGVYKYSFCQKKEENIFVRSKHQSIQCKKNLLGTFQTNKLQKVKDYQSKNLPGVLKNLL